LKENEGVEEETKKEEEEKGRVGKLKEGRRKFRALLVC